MSSKTSGDVSQRPLTSKGSSKEVNEGPATGGPQSIKKPAVQENNHNKRSTTPSLPVVEPKVQGVAGDQIATPPKLPGVLTDSFILLTYTGSSIKDVRKWGEGGLAYLVRFI